MESKTMITSEKRRLGNNNKGSEPTLNQQAAGSIPASPSQKGGFHCFARNVLTKSGLFLQTIVIGHLANWDFCKLNSGEITKVKIISEFL